MPTFSQAGGSGSRGSGSRGGGGGSGKAGGAPQVDGLPEDDLQAYGLLPRAGSAVEARPAPWACSGIGGSTSLGSYLPPEEVRCLAPCILFVASPNPYP